MTNCHVSVVSVALFVPTIFLCLLGAVVCVCLLEFALSLLLCFGKISSFISHTWRLSVYMFICQLRDLVCILYICCVRQVCVPVLYPYESGDQYGILSQDNI